MDRKIIPLCLLFFLTILGYEIASTFTSLYLKETGTSELNIGLIFSFWPLFVILFAPFAGKFSDKFGRKWLIVLTSIGYASFGFLSFFHQFILAFIILGVANAFLWTVGRAYVFDIAEGTKAKEIGYFFFSAILGSILGAPIAGKLVELTSYTFTFFIGGIVVLFGSLIGVFLLKDSRISGIEKRGFKFSKDFAILGFATIILSFLAPAIKIFLPILMADMGFSTFTIGTIFFVIKVFSALSQFIGIKVYNVVGYRKSMLTSCGINSLGLAIIGFAITLPEFLLASVFGGIGSGISGLTAQTFISRLTKAYGFGSGIYEVAANVGQWTGTWGAGLIASVFGVRELFYFSAVITFIAGLSFLFTKK